MALKKIVQEEEPEKNLLWPTSDHHGFFLCLVSDFRRLTQKNYGKEIKSIYKR